MTRILTVAVLALWSCGGAEKQPMPPPVNGGGGGVVGGGTGGGGFVDGGGSTGGFDEDGGGCGFSGSDSNPVVGAQLSPPAISGGTLAVMGDGTVVAADPDRDVVWLVKGQV